jgi:DNA-binding NtrC family response regulator
VILGLGDFDTEITSTESALDDDEAPQLCAVVSIDGVVTTHPLPPYGEIEIGRATACDLVIEHPSVTRRHASLRLSPLSLTDLGSRNGTRLRGEVLRPHVESPVVIGESFQLGRVTVLIHHTQLVTEPDTISTGTGASEHSSEALGRQLEMECARSARSGSAFAYARVRINAGTLPYEQLRTTMRVTDVVAKTRDGAFELLLPETPADQVARAVGRVRSVVDQSKAEARICVARYPFDGTTPEALIARVWEQLDAPVPTPATEMDAVRALIAQVAVGDVSVLITGETGVGKELCAEMIHRQSKRQGRPFVKLNCSAIAESLIESELFGHERGAFTGAMTARAGLFETADGGTVFLDEIGELPMSMQAKLLRVLEDRVVRRVGAETGRELDVRFVGATNRSLLAEVEAGRFRRDLYYRINGVTITLPPLRERPAEIAALARAFAARPRGNPSGGKHALGDDVLAALRKHLWPGNVRELRNTIERAVLLAGNEPVRPEHLALEAPSARRSSIPTLPIERISVVDQPSSISPSEPLANAVAEVERRRILDTLDRCGGNQTRAARMLGISRNTLVARMDAYGLPRPRKT